MPMPTMSPALIVERSICSSVSSTMFGDPYDSGVAAASTYSHRVVMTPIPNDTWLGLTRWMVMALWGSAGMPETTGQQAAASIAHLAYVPPGERRRSGAGEIDESARRIGVHELHAHVVADVETFVSALEAAFHRRPAHAHPRPFLGGAGAD